MSVKFLSNIASISNFPSDFFNEHVKFVGYDALKNGNSSDYPKFGMSNDWDLPVYGDSLFSFIGLVILYHRFAPYHKVRLKPIRHL